jgi:hypothetical protein
VKQPFIDATLEGVFHREGGREIRVDGFCDSNDGSVFRIRFMPREPGDYKYSLTYRQSGGFEAAERGQFAVVKSGRKGMLRVDAEFPTHFQWEGTKERFFWNGTTAYWLAGWDEENIVAVLDRLDRWKVSRVRVALCGRVKDGGAWFENVFPTEKFSFRLEPWVAGNPASVESPNHDVKRFNLGFWRKFERLLRHAREKNIAVSVIFYVDGSRPGVDPFGKRGMGGPDEQRYYRYAVARFAAFSNVMWDVANEYRLFRDDAWAEKMGTLLKQWDPYDHLTSTHGHGDFRFRMSPWADFAMYQSWDEHGGYAFMLKNRQEQAKLGRPIPQVNEEYGYEDHYPRGWGENRKAPARSADNRRRLAWQIYMAGGYQTTGERADRGTGWGPDSGGGWLNGRGDDAMTMLQGYMHIYDLFTMIPFWRLQPAPEYVASTSPPRGKSRAKPAAALENRGGDRTRAKPSPPAGEKTPFTVYVARSAEGDVGLVYCTSGGVFRLKPDTFQDGLRKRWYCPRDGSMLNANPILPYTYATPDDDDWVLLFRRPCDCSTSEPQE